ncbi:MAG: hypothetical protein LQ338_004090 [Usnochroma carphineum]|nr:MAG: hypothetical protein LQ338_004090 [Usnochroma carphineum]
MNGTPGFSGEQQSLGSWHPAHMPNSGDALNIDNQLSDHDVVEYSPSKSQSEESHPWADQSGPSSPDNLEEAGSKSQPSRSETMEHHDANPESYSSNSPSSGGLQRTDTVTGASGHEHDFPNVGSMQEEQDSGKVNGLSFIKHTSMTPTSDRLGSLRADLDHESSPSAQTLGQESGTPTEGTLQGLGMLDRTNSFPAVPPLHHAQESQHNVHAQSQVERIIEEEEDDEERAQKGFHGAPQQLDMADKGEGNFFGDPIDDGEDEFPVFPTGAESGNHSFSPADDEARFEEGLPLVPPEASPTEGENTPPVPEMSSQPFTSSQAATDQDFFGEVADAPEEDSFFKPTRLDRKSTSQVLDGMSYSPHSANHDEPISQEDRLPLANVFGGGIASSSSTVLSQVVAERSQLTEDSPAGIAEQKDEDLAAMWQAALDDDELLDDSEIPSDQSVTLARTQPTVNGQTLSSPDLQTVYGIDGRVLGFDSPKAAQTATSGAACDRYSPDTNQRNAASASYPKQTFIAGQQPQIAPGHNLIHSTPMPPGFGQTPVQQTPHGNVFAPSRPSMPKPAQSFADKSKGGYTSPYDLPMDVTRPKKRTNLQQVQGLSNPQKSSQPPPPPRSSSMHVRSPLSDGPSPPVPPLPVPGSSLPGGRPLSASIKEKASVGSFFEELPVVKSRPSSRAGRYPPAAPPQFSNQLPPRPEPPRQMSHPQPPPPKRSNAPSPYELVPPERHSPYANIPQQANTNTAPAQTNTRYSPAPAGQPEVPPPRNRFVPSPALVSRPPPSTQGLPFQPRTSSPLAQHSMNPQQQQHRQSSLPGDLPVRSDSPQKGATSPNYLNPTPPSALPQIDEHFEPSVGRNVPGGSADYTPPAPPSAQKNLYVQPHLDNDALRSSPSTSGISTFTPGSEPSSTSSDMRSQDLVHPPSEPQDFTDYEPPGPPRRSQTQSPGTARPRPGAVNRTKDMYQRPVSASGRLSPVRAKPPEPASYVPSHRTTHSSAQEINYIRPVDGRERDPLERWKGAPIFRFGFEGTVVTSFPKHTPRYAAGHGFPMIKCDPGEIKLQTTQTGAFDDDFATFPGPLKSKAKKKELIEWLRRKIDSLEKCQESIVPSSFLPDPVKRHEEKILLWEVMKVFVEHDGTITGSSKAEQSVKEILCPEIAGSVLGDPTLAATGGLSRGISKHDGSHAVPNLVDPNAMEAVRKLLLCGEREKAVWYAVDQRMWAHAMVLASTLDKSVWKQVLHEFTRLEVKTYGENTESLAAIYEVFAGNWDESIDQLVPPSARAGLQMVSKAASAGPTRNALDGLDRWRETLALILSNRTQDDESALVALSRLLAGYGRIEAAHLCLVFAKSTGIFGNTEDSHARVVLLGADHQQQPFDCGRDLDSILLTEVYEFVHAVLAPSASLSVSPHLQSYKLYHATLLAEHGYRSEAQQYCDAIMSTVKSTTKPSPYYHVLLRKALQDLVERLQQAPQDSSSWMSRPMDKVSGSMWKKFNNFIVGDESETASVASGKADQDAGPFARVAADTPSVSRSGSAADLYGTFTSHAPPLPPAATAIGSGYAPSNQYAPTGQLTPRSSLEQQSRSSEEQQRPGQPSMLRPSQSYLPSQSRYTASPAPYQGTPNQQQKPRYQPSPRISPRPDSYLPTPPSQPEYMPVAPPEDPSTSLYPQESYQPSTPPDSQAMQDPAPSFDSPAKSSYEPPPSVYEPNASSYEPPSSYTPYDPEGQDNQSPTDPPSRKKKKSFMDDDEDGNFAVRAAAILKGDKARKDSEADEAFRKAAEADAQRDPKDLKPKKLGWFGGVGGWLGSGKKDDGNLSSQEQPKAIKAKLGEESSFYYDKDLKKWVNKKGPAPAATEAPKPPRPRGPPSRAVSAAGGPPPASRGATPPVPPLPSALSGQTSMPPISISQPTPPPTTLDRSGAPSGIGTPARTDSPAVTTGGGSAQAVSEGPPSAPPSRPPTAVSGASSIDDLIGEPQVRKGGTIRRVKKGRGYVDVMAK